MKEGGHSLDASVWVFPDSAYKKRKIKAEAIIILTSFLFLQEIKHHHQWKKSKCTTVALKFANSKLSNLIAAVFGDQRTCNNNFL